MPIDHTHVQLAAPRRTNLKRSDYLDREDYLRDLLRSGGPDLGDLDSLGPPGTGDDG